MSDHPKVAQPNLKRIHICDDSYFDLFGLLTPKKVGLELAFVSDRLDTLVDKHFKYRKWTIGILLLHANGIIKWNAYNSTGETVPFPQVPLPNSVVGFARVNLGPFNSDAVAFLRSIDRLLQSNISLKLFNFGGNNWKDFAKSILPLFNLSAVVKIRFKRSSNFHHFRRISSPSILSNCTNLRIVTFFDDQSLQFPPDNRSSDGQALCHWLHTPHADGRPKVLKSYWAEDASPMDELKSHFLDAITPVNFIIVCLLNSPVVQFELLNSMTHEQLTCRQIGDYWTIVRCPIDRNAEQWAEWEEEAVECRSMNNWKAIHIFV